MKAKIIPGNVSNHHVTIPASKSLSHRALICAALANGVSYIDNLVENNDTIATMNCLRQLGAKFEKEGNVYKVTGIQDSGNYHGEIADCGESGSTLRFLIPLFGLTGEKVRLTGHGKLMDRPQTVYEILYHKCGLPFSKKDHCWVYQGFPDFLEYEIVGNISSQFISGLMFVLPLLNHDTVLRIQPPYESKSYVGLTEDIMECAGIKIKDDGLNIYIQGNQEYHPFSIRIDGDDSQAAFFACLSLINKQPVSIHGMQRDSRQGDHQILEILKNMGGKAELIDDGYQFLPDMMKGTEIDLQDCPDLGPVLFACATQADGKTVFKHVERLRIKESDRIECMRQELSKLGCMLKVTDTAVEVTGITPIKGNTVLNGHNDHRIVMALSVLATVTDAPVVIEGAEAISKSYPNFFEDLKNLGIEVEIYD